MRTDTRLDRFVLNYVLSSISETLPKKPVKADLIMYYYCLDLSLDAFYDVKIAKWWNLQWHKMGNFSAKNIHWHILMLPLNFFRVINLQDYFFATFHTFIMLTLWPAIQNWSRKISCNPYLLHLNTFCLVFIWCVCNS